MGVHNRVYLSREWTGADCKQILGRTARVMRSVGPALLLASLGVAVESCVRQAYSGHVMVRLGGFDSSKRAGIRCLRI
jgi:hypothetical protein